MEKLRPGKVIALDIEVMEVGESKATRILRLLIQRSMNALVPVKKNPSLQKRKKTKKKRKISRMIRKKTKKRNSKKIRKLSYLFLIRKIVAIGPLVRLRTSSTQVTLHLASMVISPITKFSPKMALIHGHMTRKNKRLNPHQKILDTV